ETIASRATLIDRRSPHLFRLVVRQFVRQLRCRLRRVLPAVLLAARALVSEDLGTTNDFDFLRLRLGGAFFVVAHGVLKSKGRTTSAAFPRDSVEQHELSFRDDADVPVAASWNI